MSVQKSAEQGWFYHAPARQQNQYPVEAPAPSQIPGLSNIDQEPEEVRRAVYRDTDSDYVRLAKRGGQEDLLQNNYSTRGRSKEAVPYPRVDWFYLEDNRVEDSEKTAGETKRDYEFLLPEYMVHSDHTDNHRKNSFEPQRAPYGFDKTTVFEREREPTLKTVKLPEMKQQGYGVRNEKLKNKAVAYTNYPTPPKPCKHTESKVDPIAANSQVQPRARPMPNLNEKDKPAMSKILAFDYGKEWKVARDNWQTKQAEEEKCSQTKHQDIFSSEYTSGFSKSEPKRGRRAGCKTQNEKRPPPKTAAQGIKKNTEAEKEPFKLSRFKNIPARTESRRPVATLS